MIGLILGSDPSLPGYILTGFSWKPLMGEADPIMYRKPAAAAEILERDFCDSRITIRSGHTSCHRTLPKTIARVQVMHLMLNPNRAFHTKLRPNFVLPSQSHMWKSAVTIPDQYCIVASGYIVSLEQRGNSHIFNSRLSRGTLTPDLHPAF